MNTDAKILRKRQVRKKSPTYKPSSCELSKMWMCIHMSNHISSCVLCTSSRACVLYEWLCFCVLYCTLLCKEQWCSIFISSTGCLEAKHKSSSDVAGTAKKHQAMLMETKVKIIERVEWDKKMVDVTHSFNLNSSTIGTVLQNEDKILEPVKSALWWCWQ